MNSSFIRSSFSSCSFWICARRSSRSRSCSASFRSVMSSAKPWLYHGRPESSRTIVKLSCSHTVRPSFAMKRYSSWSGSPLSRAARCASITRSWSSG